MYIFEIGESVIYRGDSTSKDLKRKRRSLAFIERIDDDKTSWIGIKLFPSNELIGVHVNLIRSIHTKPNHLINLGFNQIEKGNSTYFVLDKVIIADIVLHPRVNYIHHAGFSIIPSIPFKLIIEDYLNDGEVDSDKFLSDFPSVTNLNFLLELLKKQGYSTCKIEEMIEIL